MIKYRDGLSNFKSDYQITYNNIVSELEFIDGEFVFVYVNNLIPNYQFQLNEIRGRIISDYQDYLESNWLDYLFRTYDITVDWDLLKTLVSE